MAKFEKNLTEKLNKLGYSVSYFDDYLHDLEDEDPNTTNMYVGIYVKDGSVSDWMSGKAKEADGIWKTINVPKKKEVTVDYFLNKLNTDTVYKNFSTEFAKLLKKRGFDGYNVYPTTYGIGVFRVYNPNEETDVEQINGILNELNIKYTNEYSDAHWVYRYKISKSQDNIKRLNEVINESK
jgi:hypothetical protein